MSKELFKLLSEELEKADKAKDRLRISYEKCPYYLIPWKGYRIIFRNIEIL